MLHLRLFTGLVTTLTLVTTLLIAGILALSPTPHNDGVVLAYTDGRRFDFDLYLHDTASGYSLNITRDGVMDMVQPMPVTWFPDGKRFAYLARDGGMSSVRIRDVSSGATHISESEHTGLRDVFVTADGNAVFYTTQTDTGAPLVMQYHLANRTLNPTHISSSYYLSPDGRHTVKGQTLNTEGHFTITIQATDNTEGIIYRSIEDNMLRAAACVRNAGLPHDVVWQRDSQRVLISSGQHLYWLSAVDHAITPLDDQRLADAIAQTSTWSRLGGPCISGLSLDPSERYLVTRIGNRDIYVFDLHDESAPPTVLTDTISRRGSSVWAIDWLPGRTALLAVINNGGNCEYVTIDPTRNTIERLPNFECDFSIAISVHVPG